MKTMAQCWREYQSKVLDPVKAGEMQRKETKIAFYMGAMSLLDMVMSNLTPGDEPTEDDMILMNGIKAELEQFTQTMLKGRV